MFDVLPTCELCGKRTHTLLEMYATNITRNTRLIPYVEIHPRKYNEQHYLIFNYKEEIFFLLLISLKKNIFGVIFLISVVIICKSYNNQQSFFVYNTIPMPQKQLHGNYKNHSR